MDPQNPMDIVIFQRVEGRLVLVQGDPDTEFQVAAVVVSASQPVPAPLPQAA
jgi:hypothetical protein